MSTKHHSFVCGSSNGTKQKPVKQDAPAPAVLLASTVTTGMHTKHVLVANVTE
jgi:hypothetical protein